MTSTDNTPDSTDSIPDSIANGIETVMIVDDTPANLAFLADALDGAGYEVLVAPSGLTALRQLELVRPDLILLDALMPGLDGFETCQRLKARPETREIPVIFMTALTDTTDIVRGFGEGAVDYVTKPVREEEVIARVGAHIARARSLLRANSVAAALPRSSLTLDDQGRVTWLSARAAALLPPNWSRLHPPAGFTAWLAGCRRGDAATARTRAVTLGDPDAADLGAAAACFVVEYCGATELNEALLWIDRAGLPAVAPLARHFGLTPREAEVLHWVAAGKTNRDIGALLDLSPRTVTKHLEHVFTKLGVETRTAAAARALAALHSG